MKTKQTQQEIFEIRMQGHLDKNWANWFEGMTITQTKDGDTILTGPVADQAALHGLLKKVRDLGLTLHSLHIIPSTRTTHNVVFQRIFSKHFYQRRKMMKQQNTNHPKGETEMKTNVREISPSAYARFAGVLYLVITVAAIFAHMVIPDQFIVGNDAAATVANIAANESTFLLGTVGNELIILLSEIVLSMVLYVLLKPVSKTLSLVATVSRLAMTTIHGLNLLNYYFVLQLIDGGNIANAFDPEQVQALVALFLDAHSIGFTIGIAFLVPHVLILGYLIVRSGYFPKALGFLFIAAGFGYLFDATGLLLIPSYTTTPGLVAMVIAVAEIAFPVWLLVKGVNMDRWNNSSATL